MIYGPHGSVQHEEQVEPYVKRVFFTGSTAVRKGQGLCYDFDTGTTTAADGKRLHNVEVCAAGNALWFAGVSMYAYPAKTGGQEIHIAQPGSVAEVEIGEHTVITEQTLLTCSADSIDSGRFIKGQLPGAGSAIALQTVTLKGARFDGTAVANGTGLVDGAADFVTGGTNGGVAAGDKLYLVNDENANTPVEGEHLVASVTNLTTLVMATSMSGGACYVNYYILDADSPETCWAWLMPGPQQSGLAEWLSVEDNTAGDNPMNKGLSHVFGGVTLAGGNCTATLAAGDRSGCKKAFLLGGALGGNDWALSVTGYKHDGTALASLTCDGADEGSILVMTPGGWAVESNMGPTEG